MAKKKSTSPGVGNPNSEELIQQAYSNIFRAHVNTRPHRAYNMQSYGGQHGPHNLV